MKTMLPLMLAVQLLTASLVRGSDEVIPFPAALDAAAVVQPAIADINLNGIVLGNGDLKGLLWERSGDLCLRVTKNDIWDARIDTSEDEPLMKIDIANQKWSGGGRNPSYENKPYPKPRCAAIIRFGELTGVWRCSRGGGNVNEWQRRGDAGVMAVAGGPSISAGYRHDLPAASRAQFTHLKFKISGTVEAQYYVNIWGQSDKPLVASGWVDSPSQERQVSIRIPSGNEVGAIDIYVLSKSGARVENRIREITLEGKGAPYVVAPGILSKGITSVRLDLRRAVVELQGSRQSHTTARALADRNVFLIEADEDVFLEDIEAAELPAAKHGVVDGVNWMHMEMPGDQDYGGMEYALAVASVGRQKAVSLVTSFDTSRNVRDEAIRIARETADAKAAVLVVRHEAEWARYWSASGVELNDPEFQPWWYRMSYFLRCFAKGGVMPTGLWGVLPDDAPRWHGDYHHNYNSWQPYWTPFVLNHPDLADPWVRYLNEILPRMRWLAKTIYDCEGANIGISSYAFEPDPAKCESVNHRQIGLHEWSGTLGMVGMSTQILWYCHLYRPDRKYLDEKIYPVLRQTALFYCSFAEKCPRDEHGKAKFGPSYSPEHGRFGVVNVPYDISYARFTLKAAITAAGELGRDDTLAARFSNALDLLPSYPTVPDAAGKPVVVDWTGCKFGEIGVHNITVPAVPVFPADQVSWFSSEPEKELFRNTISQVKHRGSNSTVMLSVAKARLSMPEAGGDARNYYRPQVQPNGMFYWPDHGFYMSESVGIAAMISEYLLQSVDNVIRVFPSWPKDKHAKFAALRTQGGFLVSAEQAHGRVISVKIRSTVAGNLKFLNPWTTVPQARKNGAAVQLTDVGGGIYSLGTAAEDLIELSP